MAKKRGFRKGRFRNYFDRNICEKCVCVLYRPSDTSKYLDRNFESDFSDMVNTSVSENKELILMGDLNADYLNTSKNKEVKRIIKGHGLKQIIKKPTRVTKDTSTLIDIIATTHEQNVRKQMIRPNSLSDHDLVGVIIKKNCQKFTSRTVYKRNYAKYNESSFRKDLQSQPWQSVEKEQNVENAWSIFKGLLKSVIDKHVPLAKKKVQGRDCPWLTNEIRSKMNERDYWLRKARKMGKENDWSSYRRLRNAVTRIIRYSKATYTRSVFQEKQFWEQIKKCYPTKSSKEGSSKVFEINGELTSEKKIISNKFCMFFATIGRKLQNTLPVLVNQIWKHHEHSTLGHTQNPKKFTFNLKMTSIKDIRDILTKLKRKKAAGYDDIPTSLIVDGANKIAGPLSKLINRCLKMAVFPSSEKCSKITPVYKSGEGTSMDNYRPISVLPVISKVFERVVHNQLYDYLEANNMLSERQFGFRNRSSTQHAVTFFSDFIRTNMDKGVMTGAVFIDL